MPISTQQTTLKAISEIILQPSSTNVDLYQAVQQYQNLLSNIYNFFSPQIIRTDSAIYTDSGKALDTSEAARCLIDFKRTSHFIRGLYRAILHCQQQFPGEKIHILYAGTGPFAALALPVTTVFSAKDITFTFLEINTESYEKLQQTIAYFDIAAYTKDAVLADATQYNPAPGTTIHILLSETMQTSLRNEPQVAITLHLAPYLHPNGILIPQEVRVLAALLNRSKLHQALFEETKSEPSNYILIVKELIRLNRHTSSIFPVVNVMLEPDQLQQFPQLYYLTEIIIFEEEKLGFRESQLTLPELLLKKFEPKTHHCTFQYQIGSKPGFIHRIEPAEANFSGLSPS
jgi:predicted RNA methylase